MRRKTNLICCECEKPIYTDEAFYPGRFVKHARSCDNIMKPWECKSYEREEEKRRTFKFAYLETQQKRKVGFKFDGDKDE